MADDENNLRLGNPTQSFGWKRQLMDSAGKIFGAGRTIALGRQPPRRVLAWACRRKRVMVVGSGGCTTLNGSGSTPYASVL